MEREEKPDSLEDHLFLPDFCGIQMVFSVVVVAELLAFLLLLTEPPGTSLEWVDLGVLSLFIQWIALSSTALLCVMRRTLARWGNTVAGIFSYVLVLIMTLVASELAFWLMPHQTGSDSGQHLDFVFRNLGISAIISAVILRVIYLQHQQKMNIKTQSEARIQALQARIRPHFLFNSMNTIAALIRTQPANAEKAVEDLSDLFRASLARSDKMVSISEEVKIAQHYLEIEQLRLGDRLKVEWQLDDFPMQAQLPPLVLQPLIENAIYHGIEGIPEGGTIQVIGERRGNGLCIVILNPCPTDPGEYRHQGNQIAMDNIRERLLIAFPTFTSLRLERKENECRVEMCFPEKLE